MSGVVYQIYPRSFSGCERRRPRLTTTLITPCGTPFVYCDDEVEMEDAEAPR